MEKYPFLSPEWIDKVRELRSEHVQAHGKPETEISLKMNQVVTDIPFAEAELKTYVDTSGGFIDIELGELDDADVSVRLDYETAKAIFVNLDIAAAMTAFMSGRIRVTGDFSKLMALQSISGPSDLDPDDVAAKIKEITA